MGTQSREWFTLGRKGVYITKQRFSQNLPRRYEQSMRLSCNLVSSNSSNVILKAFNPVSSKPPTSYIQAIPPKSPSSSSQATIAQAQQHAKRLPHRANSNIPSHITQKQPRHSHPSNCLRDCILIHPLPLEVINHHHTLCLLR